jgi:hypothetical protein
MEEHKPKRKDGPEMTGLGAVLKTPITGDLRNRARQLGRHASPGKGDVMGIRSVKFFLAIGITFAAVLALIVGVMMWSGQQHLAKLKAQQRAHEQSEQQAEQAHANPIEAEPAQKASAVPAEKKQAAVEHCRQVQGINAWLGCMEREGVNTRELLKTGQ